MSKLSSVPLRRLGIAAALILIGIGLVACRHRPGSRGFDNEMAMGIPKVSLHATGSFFAGQLMAEATVSRGLGNMRARAEGDKHTGGPPGGGMGGGMGRRMGGDMESGRMAGGAMGPRGGLGSSSPPITLQVRLENKGQANLDIVIRDVDSALGNFVPQPDHLLLAPGQSAELVPMISRLGVVAAEIPLKLSFRAGDQTETQTIILRTTIPADSPSAPEGT